MKEPVEMFILAPAYFNVPYMNYSMEGAFTVTLPVEEMKKFQTQKEVDDFLFFHYSNTFHGDEMENVTLQFEYYFQKKAEHLMKNLTEKE